MNIFRRGLLVTAIAVTLAVGAVGSARAHALADAILNTSALRFLDSRGSPMSMGDFSALTSRNTRHAEGFVDVIGPAVSQTGPACVGTCRGTPAGARPIAPRFAPIPASTLATLPESTFGYGDTATFGALIIASNASNRRAMASLVRDGHASGEATMRTEFTFALNASDFVTLAFNANAHTLAHLPVMRPGMAEAKVFWRADIIDVGTGDTVLFYAPDELNGDSLVRREGTAGTDRYDFRGSLAATSSLLAAGTSYRLTIEYAAFADAWEGQGAVPEPATLEIVATGLFAMSLASRRRKS